MNWELTKEKQKKFLSLLIPISEFLDEYPSDHVKFKEELKKVIEYTKWSINESSLNIGYEKIRNRCNMKIYTSKNCSKCIELKALLHKRNIEFDEVDATLIKTVAYLRARKVGMQLPIVEENEKFYTFDQYKEELLS